MAATPGNATIASGATTSNAVDTGVTTGQGGLVGFVMPAAFTGASVSFMVSVDDVTYQALYDNTNTLVSVTVAASRTYGFKQDFVSLITPFRFVQFVSASSEGGSRIIIPLIKSYGNG